MGRPVDIDTEVKLQVEFGALYPLHRLIEFDHKAPMHRRILEHGDDYADACGECMREVARSLVVRERTERLMNEFVGDTIWVRTRGYKTMRRATVDVIDITINSSEPQHSLNLKWHSEARGHTVDSMMRVDVEVDGDRYTVWDDGLDDLNPFEREKMPNSSRPSKGMYDEVHI